MEGLPCELDQSGRYKQRLPAFVVSAATLNRARKVSFGCRGELILPLLQSSRIEMYHLPYGHTKFFKAFFLNCRKKHQ